ncbi:PAS domain S-box protein [Candidatus Fermentibacteria bacterium]|nr:PAS domain S-box protein [Candidatus Fermentibacteria bacterium]
MPGRRPSRKKCLEALFQTLESNMHGIAFCARYPDGPWIELIGRVREVTGWTRDDFLAGAVSWAGLVHPDDREAYLASLSALESAEQGCVSMEYRLVSKDGSIHWITDRRAVRSLEDGSLFTEGLASDSTMLKSASEALDKERDLFKHIAERSPVGIVTVSADGRVEFMNEKAGQIIGSSRNTLLSSDGRPDGWEIRTLDGIPIPDEDEPLARVFRTGKPVEGERITACFEDGRKVALSVNAVPVKGLDGRVEKVLATFDRVGDRLEPDRELLKSEQFARAVLDESPLGISVRDRNGRLLFCNRAWRKIWAIPPAEVRRDMETPRGSFRLDERDGYLGEWADAVRRVYEKGGTLHIPELKPRGRRPDSAKYVSQHFYAITDDAGNVDRVAIITEDITAIRDAVEALRESEERYRSLAEAAQDMIFVIGRDDRVKYLNTTAAKAFGVAPGAIIGLRRAELFDPVRSAQQLASLEQVFRTGKPEYRESETEFPGGRRFLGTWLVPLQGPDGGVDSVLGLARDITDRIRAIREQRDLESRLSLAQRLESIGRLAGGIAHDFNNLLTVILGRAEVLQRNLPGGDESIRETLSEISKAAEKARSLTGQLLAFGRKQMFTLESIDLNELISSFSTMLRRLIGEQIEVVTDLAPDLGATRADRSQIEQILMNLCINARDAIAGTGRIILRTSSRRIEQDCDDRDPDVPPGDYAVLSVIDNGSGMDRETLKLVFDPFFTTKEVGKGTGLGLAMVYGIVKQHGGQIRVESEPGCGSTFTVFLPLDRGVNLRSESPGEPGEIPSQASCPMTGTVLVVEDDVSLRRLMCEVFENAGFSVIEVPRPEDAARLASSRGPVDLLLSDMVMPVMSGREVSEQVLRVCPGAAVLFISGYSGMVVSEDGALEDGVFFLQKPFSIQTLLSRAREAIASVKKPGTDTGGKGGGSC